MDPGERPVFEGPIALGIGQHDYHCGKCRVALLRNVDIRQSSDEVLRCADCGAYNLVAPPVDLPEEVSERFARMYGKPFAQEGDCPADD
jgi:hypothetical protein